VGSGWPVGVLSQWSGSGQREGEGCVVLQHVCDCSTSIVVTHKSQPLRCLESVDWCQVVCQSVHCCVSRVGPFFSWVAWMSSVLFTVYEGCKLHDLKIRVF